MDYCSKWPEIAAVDEISSDRKITELGKIFGRMGYPKTLVPDNGKQLVSQKTTKFLISHGIEPRRVPLCAPNQNGLVERFNIVISEKLKECERFGWDVERTLEKMLIDYRSTPHSTTGISPFEALYGRKMRDELTRLHPELQEVPVGNIDREKVSRRQEYMKDHVDSNRKPTEWNIQIGDWVRVQGPDGCYRDYEEVSEVGKASVTLKNGDTWPVSNISSKTSRAIANKRNKVQKSSESEKGEEPEK